MVIYGNTISFGGGGGSNDTLPPLLDNFRANKGKHETVDFLSVPAGSTILLGKYKGKPIRWKVIDGFANKAGERGNNYLRIYDRNLISPRAYYEGYNYQESLPNDGSREDFTKTTLCKWLNSPDKKSPYYGNESGFLYEWTAEERNVLINWWRNTGWAINVGITVEVPEGAHIGFPHPTDPNNTFWRGLNFEKKAATTVVYTYETLSSGTLSPKAPEKEAEYLVSNPLSVEPEISIDSLTQFVFNGTDYVLESAMETQPIVISADKMEESRAKDLAGAVWVYGEHEPKNVNDGTKIELNRNDVVSSELGLSLTLGELPPSDANHKVIVNLPETDGKLHPYLYLTNDYNGSGKGCLLKYIVNETINSTGTKYEDGRFDIACQDFKNRLATSVRGYITPVTIYSWNQSTQGTHISREIFLLSRAEVAEISSNTERFKYFAIQSNRIAKDKGSAARGWWCREFNDTKPSYIDYQGLTSSTSGSQYFRPAVAMSLDLPLNPIPEEDGSYDFLETAKSKLNTIKETKQTVGNLPSKSRVKLGRYGGNELLWLTTKDAEGRQYLRLDSGSVASFPFNSMVFDNKEPNNTDTNIRNNGNNMFTLSNLFQWLNSDKPANNWYTPQHAYDAPPPYANQDGFLKGWTEQEKQLLLNKVWEVRVPSSVSSSLLKFVAKVVLPSTTEMGLESNTGGSRLDIFNNSSDRIINGSPWWSRNSEKTNTHQVVHPNYNGNIVSSNCNKEEIQVVPLVSIPINTPVELGSDGAYHFLLDVMLPTVKVAVTYPKNKNFYARQFTYNGKKQYQTMLKGAVSYLPIMPDGQELSKLPSKSKVKLGRYGDADLQWLVSRNAENKLILALDSNSISALGNKMLDAAEPSNGNSDRQKYGNNRCIYTNLHQWLNAEKGANQWFVKAHNADTPPDYQNQAGFLNGWKKEELDLLELAEWTVTKSGTDGSGKETFRSRVVLPSTTEMGFSSEGGGSKLDIFNSDSDRQTGSTYWTRTPFPTSPCINYQVKSDGTQYSGGYNSYDGAIRPICSIPETTLVSIETDSEGCFTLV